MYLSRRMWRTAGIGRRANLSVGTHRWPTNEGASHGSIPASCSRLILRVVGCRQMDGRTRSGEDDGDPIEQLEGVRYNAPLSKLNLCVRRLLVSEERRGEKREEKKFETNRIPHPPPVCLPPLPSPPPRFRRVPTACSTTPRPPRSGSSSPPTRFLPPSHGRVELSTCIPTELDKISYFYFLVQKNLKTLHISG